MNKIIINGKTDDCRAIFDDALVNMHYNENEVLTGMIPPAPNHDWTKFETHNCVFTTASAQGVHSNTTQFGWVAPAWPAWDAAKEDWSAFNLCEGITDPPLTSSAPYVGYETDMWGDDRKGLSGFSYGIKANVPPEIVGQNIEYVRLNLLEQEIVQIQGKSGQTISKTKKARTFVLNIMNLNIVDSDNTVPDDMTMTVLDNSEVYDLEKVDDHNYLVTVNYNHIATYVRIPVYVNDGTNDSNTYTFKITCVYVGKGDETAYNNIVHLIGTNVIVPIDPTV